MIQIKDIFAKDINRDIRGVIKIGQDSDDIKQQELEEYVVTDELKRNFTRFFDAYDKSINNPTDEMGAWISGFFGSGKSHFLKILSYLLDSNLEVDGKISVDFQDFVLFANDISLEKALSNLADELIDYAHDYLNDIQLYYNSPNRKKHLPYVLQVLLQENKADVIKLLHADV